MPDVFRSPPAGMTLPPYRAVLVVDAERYSRASSLNQRALSGKIPAVLEAAFHRAGLADQWERASFPQSTGDGFVVGVDPAYLGRLVHPLLGEIQHVLEGVQDEFAVLDRSLRLRLRAGIEVGPLHDTGGADGLDGVGHAMTETHRLVDSPPVRAALSESAPDITLLSAIISRRVYQDAVQGGYTGLARDHFHAAHAAIPAKEFSAEAYVYVPRPSGNPATRSGAPDTADTSGTNGEGPDATGRPQPPRDRSPMESGRSPRSVYADRGATANQAGSVSGGGVQAGAVHGGLHTGDRFETGTRYGGIGDISGGVGTVISGASGPVHAGRGDQYNSRQQPEPTGKRRRRPDRDAADDRDGPDLGDDGWEGAW